MEETVLRQIQREAADALLNAGISVPLKEFHLPFKKKPVRLRITLKRPYMSGQIRIARTYLSMNVKAADMENFTKEQEMAFLVEHGVAISRIIAYTICVGFISQRLFVGLVAWFIRHFVEHRYMMLVFKTFTRLMGSRPFTTIIRSAEMANPLKRRLSHMGKGS